VSQDSLFVADRDNDRVVKFDRDGGFVAEWSRTPGSPNDEKPTGLALGPFGGVYVSQAADNAVSVYEPDGSFFVSYSHSTDDQNLDDSYDGVAVGPNGLYVADPESHRVLNYLLAERYPRALLGGGVPGWETGQVSLAYPAPTGSGTNSFDGASGVAVDPALGYLYVADTENDRILKFKLSGGSFVRSWSRAGKNGPKLSGPSGVAVDANGNVYVADTGNDRIRKYSPQGKHIGSFGTTGSGTGELEAPKGIALDDSGNLYVAEGAPNHRVQKFAPVSGSGVAAADGGNSDSGASVTISEQAGLNAVTSALQSLGLAPQGGTTTTGTLSSQTVSRQAGGDLSEQDYVGTEVDADGDRRLRMWIGPDGNIIPDGAWRQANSDYCADQNRYLKPAKKLLNIKVYAVPDGYFAFAQYIDLATGKIAEQREGEASGLERAIKRALNRLDSSLDTPLGSATGPCGEKRTADLTFRFETEFTEEYRFKFPNEPRPTLDRFTQHATASGALSYNDQKGYFEGSARLQWKTYEADEIWPDRPYLECEAPTTGTVEIIYRADADGTNATDATLVFSGVEDTPCTQENPTIGFVHDVSKWRELPYYWREFHDHEYDKNTGEFTIQGWKSGSGDPQVVARKGYDFTETPSLEGGSREYSETTTIEIRE
jgi:DNA-binding beta-propeller fold protein YncE